ncbi:helix-turn-helix domain-containing protein [Nocardia sp. CC201C]|nr:helix-turn-helix domain-containing protein [Nocardia sp. CC201C]
MASSKKQRGGENRRSTSAYMRLKDVADLFGVHECTVRRWISAGRLTGYMVGPNTIRVRRDEVMDLLRPIPTAGGAA